MAEINSGKNVIQQVIDEKDSERLQAIALHDYVRDQVKFGFNQYFDASPPSYTIAFGYGHCNPKSHLMVALFQQAGLGAYQHFVVIPKEILKGAIPPSRYWMIPSELSHSYVEVKINGKWLNIDSFIVDTPLLEGAKTKLAQEGLPIGYGVRHDSINTWNGEDHAFSQFDDRFLIEDHGRVEDMESYFESDNYRNVVFGLRFNTMFQWMGENGVKPMNDHIEMIRRSS